MRPWRAAPLLSLVFSAAFALAVGAVALVLRLGVESGFQTYLDASQAGLHGRIMGALEALAGPEGRWKADEVADLGRQALAQGLVLSVWDAKGHVVWSARTEDPRAVDEVFDTLQSRLRSRAPWQSGWWQSWNHPVESAGGPAGTMDLEVFQPRRLGPADLAFLQGIDGWLAGLACLGLVVGTVAGVVLGRRLARPLAALQTTVDRLGSGDYRTPSPQTTVFREVRDLEEGLGVLADRLARLQALRDTAGADTAHELRTPLANLEAQLEALEDGVLPAEPSRFAVLGQEVRRLLSLVEAWEDLERTRQPRPLPGRCDNAAPVVAEAASGFEARLLARGQTLVLDLAGAPSVPLAPSDLARIVTNLVENAHRYAASRIGVSLTPVIDGVELVVDDDGPGIPPDHRDAVFDRFYRVDASRSRRSGGLGLGLSLVKALASSAGGGVWAEESPWGGCRIHVRLPK